MLCFPFGEILLLGIRRIQSFARIRRSVGGPRHRCRISAKAHAVTEGLALNDAERLVLQRLEKGPATIETLCSEIYASNFEIHQALWALKVLGAVEDAEGTAEVPSGTFSVEGSFGPGGVVEIVVRLCRAGETGVLHVASGTLERSFHIREGRCVFATSNDIDHGLVAFLMRRGVVSLIPANTTAEVFFPGQSAEAVKEGGKLATRAEGVKFLRGEGGNVVFAVGSGSYQFSSPFQDSRP